MYLSWWLSMGNVLLRMEVIIGHWTCRYSVSRSRTLISSGWLSIPYLHAGYAVCVPTETMAHGYAVNWGDSLTLYRHCYARAETIAGRLQWEQTSVDNIAILLANPAGGNEITHGVTKDYYCRLLRAVKKSCDFAGQRINFLWRSLRL